MGKDGGFCAAPCMASMSLGFLFPLALPRCSSRQSQASSSPSKLANLLSCKPIVSSGIVVVMGKKFIHFQFCSVGRLLKALFPFAY